MKNLTLNNLARVCRGRYCGGWEQGEQEVKSIVTDSRQTEPGALFVAIPGERVDGHVFIEDVIAKGALAVMSERDLGQRPFPYIQVESSLQAVKYMAQVYLEQLQIPVVGITGSVGKTSTKEVIASVLSQKFCVLKTKGNFNNELGLPLTVFGLRQEHEMAVLEMGINQFGEMTRLAKIARPDTCVITNIGPCHLEYLGSRDGVFRAKTEVFPYIKPGGRAVLNGDDDKLSEVERVNGSRPLFFGMSSSADVWADMLENHGLEGMRCRIHIGEDSFWVQIPIPGEHMIYNALAAVAVGKCYGLNADEIRRGIESLEPVDGRLRMVKTGTAAIIDDCYNANPVSMKASLEVLKNTPGRKTAILGDMGELGSNEAQMHREVGAYAGACGLDLCICVGGLSRHMAEAAREKNPHMEVVHLKRLEELMEILPGLAQKGGTILVKASHFMEFHKVVHVLEGL